MGGWGPEPQVRAPRYRDPLFERDLLDVPFGTGTSKDHIVRYGVHLVDDASRLALSESGLRPAKELSVVIEPVNFARAIAAINVLWRNLDAPRRAYSANGFLEVQIVVINLDPEVATVGDINVPLRVRRAAVRDTELIFAGTVRSDCLHPTAALCNLDDALVAIAIAHKHTVL